MEDFQFLHKNLDLDEQEIEDKKLDLKTKLPKVFLVEDDEILGRAILKYLKKHLQMEIYYFTGPAECLIHIEQEWGAEALAEKEKFILVSDISFAEGAADGLLLIDLLKEKGHDFVSIAMTGFASIETAITATKKGVFHYLTKPFELNILNDLVIKAAVTELGHNQAMVEFKNNRRPMSKSLKEKTQYKICAAKPQEMFCGMIGRSQIMQNVFERIKKVAASESTIFISGPSGTGKELVASAIHHLSLRKDFEKVSVNCGAIPAELLESELFGHEKGSFTGAVSSRIGRFEMASRGTIFLDEIGDMPLLLQVKLLRVLQNRTIERIGNNQSIPIDVRIITATHRDLEKEIETGNFREDLFYRLNVIPIILPALCERKDDIPLLISYFLSRFVSADGRNHIDFEDDALELLISYNWPGNVRELENLIERLVILKGGSSISVSDLPAKFLNYLGLQDSARQNSFVLPKEGLNLKETMCSIENSLIEQALKVTLGNKNQASRLLQMNRTTLIEKMKKKGISLSL